LHTASEHGFLNNVRQLIEAGADTYSCEGHGLSCVDLAERGGHTATFEYLKNAAVSKEEARESSHYALREAVCSSDSQTVQKLLKDIGKDEAAAVVNMTPNGTNTLLFK
jgi:ankyrin repeat protein